MALLDIFKKKKVEKEKVSAKGGSASGGKESIEKAPVSAKSKKSNAAALILKSPHITEKASILAESNRYVFKVNSRSNKIEIKKAVEGLYGVKVESVNIIIQKRKKKRVGRRIGYKTGYKKAIVEVTKGQKIDIMPR